MKPTPNQPTANLSAREVWALHGHLAEKAARFTAERYGGTAREYLGHFFEELLYFARLYDPSKGTSFKTYFYILAMKRAEREYFAKVSEDFKAKTYFERSHKHSDKLGTQRRHQPKLRSIVPAKISTALDDGFLPEYSEEAIPLSREEQPSPLEYFRHLFANSEQMWRHLTRELSAKQLLVIELRYKVGLNGKQIGKLMKMSYQHVNFLTRQAYGVMRQHIGSLDEINQLTKRPA